MSAFANIVRFAGITYTGEGEGGITEVVFDKFFVK